MSTQVSAAAEGLWAGGGSPYRTNSKKLGMWLFIVSDSLTFAALLFAYTYSRVSNPNWPTPFHFSPSIIFSSIMTFCLLSSSLTMVGGATFVVLHLSEWLNLINNEHVTPGNNPWDVPLFGGTFFGLTGLHMTHVIIGLIYLAIIAQGVFRGKFKAEDVEVSGLYWHFVDLVWMFIFPLVYLIDRKSVV